MIPEDWDEKPLKSLNPFITSGSRGWAKYYADVGDAFVRITNLSRQNIYPDMADLRRVKLPAGENEGTRTGLRNGDVLVSITADIGIIGYVDDRVPKPAYINQHIAAVRVDPSEADSKFLSYFLATEGSQRRVRAATDAGAKAGMSLPGVGNLPVACPPTVTEQAAIAEALSDMDEAIAAVEAVIAKKRAINTATMQTLLSGTHRLPGFSGEWAKTPIGRLGRWVGGATPSMANPRYWANGSIPWASSSDVRNGRLSSTANLITPDAVKFTATREVPKNTILLVTRSGILRRFLPVAITTRNIAINQDLKALLVDPAFDPHFVYHAIAVISDEILNSCMKAGTTVESIDLNWLKLFELPIPSCTDEQFAIAAALFDADDELSLLDAKLAKLRRIKTGMMQQLLTGKIRLV